MTDPVDRSASIGYTTHAGRVLFPRTPDDLRSTSNCPACFTALTSTTCSSCGLDLAHLAAAELAIASTDVAAALDRRLAIIGRIRYETAAASATATASMPAAPSMQPPPAPAPIPTPISLDPREARPNPREIPLSPIGASNVEGKPRRSSVQVILLVVGVSLLSVAAIFFLVYAFINFGIVWRSVIIGAITVTAFVVASLLRRRALDGTAEGIAVFGVVLVYLDAFAIRANDLFDASGSNAAVYWGATLLATSALFGVWNRVSGLRVASLAAVTALVPGVASLAYGLADDATDTAATLTITFAAASAAGLLHPLVGGRGTSRSPERAIVLGLASTGWLVAAVSALFLEPERGWVSGSAVAALALVAAGHALLAARSGAEIVRAWAFGWTGAAAVGAAAATGVGLLHGDLGAWALALPALGAGVVAAAFDVVRGRTDGAVRRHALVAAIASGSLAALALLPAVVVTIGLGMRTAVVHDGNTGAFDTLPGVDEHTVVALGGLFASLALATLSSAAAGALTARRLGHSWAAGLLEVFAARSGDRALASCSPWCPDWPRSAGTRSAGRSMPPGPRPLPCSPRSPSPHASRCPSPPVGRHSPASPWSPRSPPSIDSAPSSHPMPPSKAGCG
jgi:hypothetical protein